MRLACTVLAARNTFLRRSNLYEPRLRRTVQITGTNEKAGQKTDSFIGTPGGIRTPDLRYRKPTLYPAKLRVHVR